MNSTIEIEVVNHREVIAETLKLFNLVFRGTGSKKPASLDQWSWKHLNNPLMKGQSDVVVARSGGRIVGANCFIVVEFTFGGDKILAVQSCDSMVHPAFRGCGIFSKMIVAAESHFKKRGYSFAFGFPNQNSLPGFTKLGWKQVRTMCRWDLLLNLEGVLQKLAPKMPLKGLMGHLYRIFDRNAFIRSNRNVVTFDFETSTSCPEALKDLSDTFHPGRMELNRDGAYLRWRVDASKSLAFEYVFSKNDRGLIWYSVVGHADHQIGTKIGYIADLQVKRNYEQALPMAIYASSRVLSRAGCDIVSFFTAEGNAPRSRILRSLGFRTLTRYFKLLQRQQHVVAPLLVKELNPSTLSYDLYDPQIWDPTQLYFDGP